MAVRPEQSGQKDNVKVVIRVRPCNERERCKSLKLYHFSGRQPEKLLNC